jgi:hypothetical protein
MTNVEKLLMKRMKKTDSKVNYKTLHLDTLKEIEKNKHLRGDSYADSVIDDMSEDDLYWDTPNLTQTKEETMMKVNVSGTHKENMAAINNAEISEGFKAHIRMELKKHYDSIDNVPDYISGWGCKLKCCK